jgi:hypothetical protein
VGFTGCCFLRSIRRVKRWGLFVAGGRDNAAAAAELPSSGILLQTIVEALP